MRFDRLKILSNLYRWSQENSEGYVASKFSLVCQSLAFEKGMLKLDCLDTNIFPISFIWVSFPLQIIRSSTLLLKSLNSYLYGTPMLKILRTLLRSMNR